MCQERSCRNRHPVCMHHCTTAPPHCQRDRAEPTDTHTDVTQRVHSGETERVPFHHNTPHTPSVSTSFSIKSQQKHIETLAKIIGQQNTLNFAFTFNHWQKVYSFKALTFGLPVTDPTFWSFFSFSRSFRHKLCQIIGWRPLVFDASFSGKSWIRHC